jgi:PKD repeat protein
VSTECNGLYIAQMNHGSEFIGKVTILGSQSNLTSNNTNSIVTCNIYLKISVVGNTATADVSDYLAPLTYEWSNGGGKLPTATYSTPGTYSLTVTDANNCSTTQSFIIV